MGFMDTIPGGSVGSVVGGEGPKRVDFGTILAENDLISVQDEYIVVAPKQLSVPNPGPETTELGGYGESAYYSMSRTDYNPAMGGVNGLKKFDEMRRSDSGVRKSLRTIKTPIIGARWYMEPASESKKDRQAADFAWKCLNQYMSVSWPQLLMEVLSFLDFGWYCLEPVYEIRVVDGKQRVVWKKLAPRHPLDSYGGWKYDAHGGPDGCWFYANSKDGQETLIPIDRLLAFTFDKEAGNMEGISVLRSAYKHWYFKDNLYKIDAIQKERHGIGIPIIKLPVNFTPADKAAAENLGANLRTNEKAHVVLPPMWELLFAKLEGQPVDCLRSIEHHDAMIMGNVMAEFLTMTGNVDAQMDMFVKGTRFIADIVRDVFNKWAIPKLIDYNFDVGAYPELKVRRIGDTTDWRVLSFAMRNLVGANILQVDDRLEEWTRDEMDLPRLDPETVRVVATPQAPVAVGAPKQAVAGNQKVGVGSGQAGKDSSGTSGTK